MLGEYEGGWGSRGCQALDCPRPSAACSFPWRYVGDQVALVGHHEEPPRPSDSLFPSYFIHPCSKKARHLALGEGSAQSSPRGPPGLARRASKPGAAGGSPCLSDPSQPPLTYSSTLFSASGGLPALQEGPRPLGLSLDVGPGALPLKSPSGREGRQGPGGPEVRQGHRRVGGCWGPMAVVCAALRLGALSPQPSWLRGQDSKGHREKLPRVSTGLFLPRSWLPVSWLPSSVPRPR